MCSPSWPQLFVVGIFMSFKGCSLPFFCKALYLKRRISSFVLKFTCFLWHKCSGKSLSGMEHVRSRSHPYKHQAAADITWAWVMCCALCLNHISSALKHVSLPIWFLWKHLAFVSSWNLQLSFKSCSEITQLSSHVSNFQLHSDPVISSPIKVVDDQFTVIFFHRHP